MTEPRTDAGPTPLPRRRGGGFVEAAVPTPLAATPPAAGPRGGRHRADVPVAEEPLPDETVLDEATAPAVQAAPPAAPPVPAPRPAATVPAPAEATPPRERRDTRPPTGDFYGPATSRPAFNPGNASPFHVPRTEGVPRRVGRHPVKTLTTWAAVLVALAIGAKYGYPVVMEQVHRKEIQAVTADLRAVSSAQETYFKVNGSYAPALDSLGLGQTVSKVTVVSASSVTFCLQGTSVAGGVVRWSSPAQGVSDKPCV